MRKLLTGECHPDNIFQLVDPTTYVEGDFERDIAARTNVSELVAKNVEAGLAAREFGAIGLGSGVTDVYQPIERDANRPI